MYLRLHALISVAIRLSSSKIMTLMNDNIPSYYMHIIRGYPAKKALSAMRKHGGWGPFGRIPSNCLLLTFLLVKMTHKIGDLKFNLMEYEHKSL